MAELGVPETVGVGQDSFSSGRVSAVEHRRLTVILLYSASIVGALAVWQVAAVRFALPLLFPPPLATFKTFVDITVSGDLESAAVASLLRILAGFALGSVAGVLLGLIMGMSSTVRAIAEPYVHFFRFVPPLAWFAPVLLWFGTGEGARVILIVYTTVFVVTLNTMAGVIAVPANKIRMAHAFGARPQQVFSLIVLPATVPFALTGMRIAMGNSFMTVVAAEMLAANDGLGYLVNSGILFLDTAQVFSGVLALGALGLVTDVVFRVLIRRYGARFTVGSEHA